MKYLVLKCNLYSITVATNIILFEAKKVDGEYQNPNGKFQLFSPIDSINFTTLRPKIKLINVMSNIEVRINNAQ